MGAIRVDNSRWPIAVHSVEGTPTDAEVDAYIEQATAALLRGEKHVVVLDASAIGDASPYVRERATKWQQKFRNELRACCVGTAYVLRSPLMRFVAMTILLVTRLPTPYFVCATREEAMAWAAGRLAAAGVSPSGSPAP